jgi:hypothetical protein
LRVASNNGRFDVVKYLFEAGADHSHLEWTPLFHAIAYGSLTELNSCIQKGDDLSVRDTWERTPVLPLNMLIQVWYERGIHYWEELVSVGQIEDDTDLRKYRDCLNQIERMERMLKMTWRERYWEENNPPVEQGIKRYHLLILY